METKYIKLKNIKANSGQIEGLPKNPRCIRDDKFRKLKASIEENPEMLELRELLVYPHGEDYIVIGGNMRFRVCQELGYKELPCKVIPESATVEQLKAYTIKDNSGFGEWDWDALANEWDSVKLEEWGLDFPVMEEASDITPEENGDKDGIDFVSDGTASCSYNYLSFGKRKVLLTEDELNALEDKYKEYVATYGMEYGFINFLLNGNN